MTAIISDDGSIEIPPAFRAEDSVRAGQTCEIERVGRGEYRVKVRDEKEAAGRGSWVDILLACPVKGWFEPARGQTTDDLKTACVE